MKGTTVLRAFYLGASFLLGLGIASLAPTGFSILPPMMLLLPAAVGMCMAAAGTSYVIGALLAVVNRQSIFARGTAADGFFKFGDTMFASAVAVIAGAYAATPLGVAGTWDGVIRLQP